MKITLSLPINRNSEQANGFTNVTMNHIPPFCSLETKTYSKKRKKRFRLTLKSFVVALFLRERSCGV